LMMSDSPAPSTTQKASIDQILQAGWYLLRLINEILDLAMIESGKVSLSKEAISLTEVLLDCKGMMAPQAEQRGIEISFPNFENMYFVHADRTRVKQVIVNLLSNAIKYNRTGGAVTVGCRPGAAGLIRVSVMDTGAGLEPEKLAHLFQPFNRLGQENSAEEGTGIGLVVTKKLIELMGGSMGVDSAVGVGSEFWFDLLETEVPGLTPDSIDETPAVVDDAGLELGQRNRTLLYVEDNPANLALVEQLIARRDDLQLISAITGHRGVMMAKQNRPDVILMDINLPGMSGYGALQLLRTDPTTSHIPVIALSANAMPRDIEKGIDAGFFNYLTKPIMVREFMDALDVALRHAATLQVAHEY
jgi:CheY-like chemotaxis protein